MPSERAITDTISTVLIILLVVALAIIVVVFVFGIHIFQPKSAFIAPSVMGQNVAGKQVISLFNKAGDTAYLNLSNPQIYSMSVWVDSAFGVFRALPVAGADKFAPGTTFFIFYNGTTGAFNITDNQAGLALAAATLPAGITGVHLVDENAHLLIFQSGTAGIPAAGLSILSVIPGSGYNNSPGVALAINGTGFLPGAGVRLNMTGMPDITATGVIVVNGTKITCTVNINNTTAGPRNVIVTLPIDGRSAMLANGFTVNLSGPAPTLTAISNATGNRGWPLIERATGTNFVSGTTLKLNRTGTPDIVATSCSFSSATQIVCTFDLTGTTASPPTYNAVVTNPDGKLAMRAGAFTLNSPAPTITSSTPNAGLQAATVNITSLAGTGFQPGALVTYNQGATSIPLTSLNVVSSTVITGTVVIPGNAPTGAYSVTVTNTDGKTVTRAATFTVNSNAPTVTGITPAAGNRGWPVSITNLAGTNFQAGATASLNRSGYPDVACTGVVAIATKITCTLNLAGVQAGAWNVTVTNSDGKSGSRVNAFTVNSPAPTITSSTPNAGLQGTTVSITNLRGTNFQPGALVTYDQGATSIPLTGITVVSATQITGTLVIPDPAPTGAYSVTVKNTDGGTVTRAATFTVNSNAPTVTSIAPATAPRGWPVSITNIGGTNFQSGATVKLNRTGYADIGAAGVTVVSATSITCSFDLLGKQAGAWNVVVTNPNGRSGMRASGFTISNTTPTLTGSTPNTGARGTTVTIASLTGTAFQPGATVTFTRAPTTITLTGVTVVSPATITGTLVIPAGATTGSYSITILNTDGTTRTTAGLFTVT